jgi:hypothetical protein
MGILDTLPEGYDLVCTRCGVREIIETHIEAPLTAEQ